MIRAPRRKQRYDGPPRLDVQVVQSSTPRFVIILAAIVLSLLAVAALASGGLSEVTSSLSAACVIAYRSLSQALPSVFSSKHELRMQHELQEQSILDIGSEDSRVVPDGKGGKFKIVDLPVPPQCHARAHAELGGFIVSSEEKSGSAAECCRRCKAFRVGHGRPQPCNAWMWCGDWSGKCWTTDGAQNHTTGDCLLKFQPGWDNITDYRKTNLQVHQQGRFNDTFRKERRIMHEWVPWVSGIVAPDF